MISRLKKVLAGCHDKLYIRCRSTCRCTFNDTNAFVAKRGGSIFICARFFQGSNTNVRNEERAAILWREFGRTHLWDELPDEETGTMRDINVWDFMIETLCRAHERLIKR